jgi:Ca-activated chloride channel family protein
LASNIVMPQGRPASRDAAGAVRVTDVTADVVILEQAATTTLEIGLENATGSRQEAELIVPVPQGAAVRSFTFQGTAKEPSAEVLPRDEAVRTYEQIVAKVRDPAMLEFLGYALIRSSVFPVEARGKQRVRLTYEHLLPADGDRIDYVLPRSESLDYAVPWAITVRITSKRPISTLYSPSHKLEVTRPDERTASARLQGQAASEPGPFRLSYLLDSGSVSASLLAYPDPKVGGGYFLLLAGLPVARPQGAESVKREVTLVLDRSGSMNGEKLEQVREASAQVVAGLKDGETFNIMAYNEAVERFAQKPVVKGRQSEGAAREYLRSITSRGGTNIHDALVEALRQEAPQEGVLPVVIFLTDGLPTVGETSETAIREVAVKGNLHKRRVFTFGVGVDVNTPLLEKIASETRGSATFVLPGEDVEVKVSRVYQHLAGPLLTSPDLQLVNDEGEPAAGRVTDVVPSLLSDLFEGDQVVVLGRYVGEKPLCFVLTGDYLGRARRFRFSFDLAGATTRNSFVPRLWASRKIAVLVDAIRQLGADHDRLAVRGPEPAYPKMKELVDEIVRLSMEFGVLTEYTAFLAREGTDLSRPDELRAAATDNFMDRAVRTRYGVGSVNQSLNSVAQQKQSSLNISNSYYDSKMNAVSISNVQQVNDRAFYQRGDRWVDSRLLEQKREAAPDKVVQFGSEEFRRLALRLAEEGRPGTISLRGDILMVVDGETVLISGAR